MASKKRKNEKENKPNFVKKYWTSLLAALGISTILTGCGAAKPELEKEIKLDIKDIDEGKGQNIEDKIESSIGEEITLDEPEEVVEEEETKEDEESLDVSKDKNTITSNSVPADYDYFDGLVIPIIKNFDTVSIVDALNEVGYDSSKASRAKLAVYFNIVTNPNEYRGTSEQNTLLLQYLRQYAIDFQNSAHDDYIKVIDNSTIENSVNGNYSNDNENKTQEENPQEKPDDNDKKPQHKWSKWKALDDEKEYRVRDDGKKQYQKHPSYGDWIDNGDDTKSRTCDNCGHTMTKDYVWGDWIAIDDELEYREREDGKREEQDHPYSEWINNNDGTKSRTCPNCNHTMTKDYVWGDWIAIDDELEYREREDGKRVEQNHPYGEWVDIGNNKESRTCPNCKHIQTREKAHIHNLGEWQPDENDKTKHYRECLDCGEIFDRTDHTLGAWTDREDGKRVQICPTCGYEKECPHDLDNAKWEYTDSNNHKYICPTCGKEEVVNHQYGEEGVLNEIFQTMTYTCSDCGHEKIYKRKETILNISEDKDYKSMANDEHCKIVEWKSEDGTIIKTEYLPHVTSKNQIPIYTFGGYGYYTCIDCEFEFAKVLDGNEIKTENQEQEQISDEVVISEEEQTEDESVVINFDFDIPPRNNEDYEYFDEEYSEELEKDNTLLLEDKGTSLMIEDKQENLQDAIASFDKELYKKLFKEKIAIEQILVANKGIDCEKELQLLEKIDAMKASMVQKLAESLVREELKAMRQDQAPTLGLRS